MAYVGEDWNDMEALSYNSRPRENTQVAWREQY